MARKGVGSNRCFRAACNHDITDSLINNFCGVGERNQASSGLSTNVATIAPNTMSDRNLTNAGSIEPGNGLIGTDIFGAFFPAQMELLLTKSVATGTCCEDCPNTSRVLLPDIQTRLGDGLMSAGQVKMRPAIGLGDNARIYVLNCVKILDNSGHFTGKTCGVEACKR